MASSVIQSVFLLTLRYVGIFSLLQIRSLPVGSSKPDSSNIINALGFFEKQYNSTNNSNNESLYLIQESFICKSALVHQNDAFLKLFLFFIF